MKTLFTFLVFITITLNSIAQSYQPTVDMAGGRQEQGATGTQTVYQNGSYYRLVPANFEEEPVSGKINRKGNLLAKLLFAPELSIINLIRGGRKGSKRSSPRMAARHQVEPVPYSNRLEHATIHAGSTIPQNRGSYPQNEYFNVQTSTDMQRSSLPSTQGQNMPHVQQPMQNNTQPIYTEQSHLQGQYIPSGQTGYAQQNNYMQHQSPYGTPRNNPQVQQSLQNQQPNYQVQSHLQGQYNPSVQTDHTQQNKYVQHQSQHAPGPSIVQYQQPMQNNQQPYYPVQTYPQGQINPYVQSGYQPIGTIQANGFVQSPTEPKQKKQIGKKIFKGLSAALEIAGDLGVVPGLGVASKVINKISQ